MTTLGRPDIEPATLPPSWSAQTIAAFNKRGLLFSVPGHRHVTHSTRLRDALIAGTWFAIGVVVTAMLMVGVGLVGGKP